MAGARTEEVRLALALNGGVSLAVWMGGAAVELDAARRAHLGPEALEQGSPRTLYATLCQAFDRVLVIDLMTGSSAGGINGALLAAAIRNRRRLHPDFLRDSWLRLGDLGKLLHATSEPEPRSLMQGELLHRGLLDTFEALDAGATGRDARLTALPAGQEERAGALAGEVALEITTTHVTGTTHTFQDAWREPFVATEYRQRFRFDEHADFEPAALASAARASASFPFAFPPWRLEDRDLPHVLPPRWTVDGGLLDNAPIKAVLDRIPSRPASRPVRRYLCYVNADPPLPPPTAAGDDGGEPRLEDVVGYVLGLPRKATFIEHLYAIRAGTRNAELAGVAELSLLELDRGALTDTAAALWPAYRRVRRLRFLSEVLPGKHDQAEAADRALGTARELPFIPVAFTVPAGGGWGWGVLPAQRALALLLDVLRHAAEAQAPGNRTALLAARAPVDAAFGELERLRRRLMTDQRMLAAIGWMCGDGDVAAELERLRVLYAEPGCDPFVRAQLRAAAEAVHAVGPVLGRFDRLLFGDEAEGDRLSDRAFAAFLERALGIEVVRRAFRADEAFDSAQKLHFAQLTPCVPALILAPDPLADRPDAPATPDAKLTGLGLGHFAAFYRSSWRANDFMWGRLDAAVRMVDLLVDAARARRVAQDGDGADAPWDVVAGALCADATHAQAGLIAEALDAAGVPPVADLRVRLGGALRRDLSSGDGRLTRAVCARAAQYEVLRDELPSLVSATTEDVAAGAGGAPLDLPADLGDFATIEALRRAGPLPVRLAAAPDSGEEASRLAIRTGTHAAFVGLAAMRAARLPFGPVAFVLRGPLLSAAGSVAVHWGHRLLVALAYTAFSAFVAARLATMDGGGEAAIRDLRDPYVIAFWVAALGVLAVAAVPFWRGRQTPERDRRRRRLALGAALVLCGGLAGGVLALSTSAIGWDEVLVQSGARSWVDPVALVAVLVAAALPVVLAAPRLLQRLAGVRGAALIAPTVALAGWFALGGWAYVRLAAELDTWLGNPGDHGWRLGVALLGAVAGPLLAFASLLPSGGGWRAAVLRRR